MTNLNGSDVVFVSNGRGYQTRKVVTGGTSDGATVILSGVRPGEQVVSSGTSALKALAQAN